MMVLLHLGIVQHPPVPCKGQDNGSGCSHGLHHFHELLYAPLGQLGSQFMYREQKAITAISGCGLCRIRYPGISLW